MPRAGQLTALGTPTECPPQIFGVPRVGGRKPFLRTLGTTRKCKGYSNARELPTTTDASKAATHVFHRIKCRDVTNDLYLRLPDLPALKRAPNVFQHRNRKRTGAQRRG